MCHFQLSLRLLEIFLLGELRHGISDAQDKFELLQKRLGLPVSSQRMNDFAVRRAKITYNIILTQTAVELFGVRGVMRITLVHAHLLIEGGLKLLRQFPLRAI